MKSRIILSFLLLFSVFANASDNAIPLETFASLPDVGNVSLSPDGSKIVSLVNVNTPEKQGTAIAIFDVKSKATSYPAYVDNERYVISSVRWKGNDRLLIKARFAESRYGTPTIEYRMVQLDLESKKIRPVLSKRFLESLRYMPNIQTNVIDYLDDDDNAFLLQMGGGNVNGDPGVVLVNLNKGRTRYIQSGMRNVQSWITDTEHTIRIGVYLHETRYKIYERKTADDDFRTLWEFEAFSDNQVWPIGFGKDNNILFVLAPHNGKDAVFKVDLNDPALSKELVYANKHYDVRGSIQRSSLTKEVIGIGDYYWDQDIAKLQGVIDKSLPGFRTQIISFSADMNRYIVLATSDVEPGIYIVGDRKAKSMDVVAYRYSKISPEMMNEKKAFTYKARDGLEIEGFLTLPGDKKEKLPTVIFPHGGPISFDNDGFDYWTQFFASRGYAVVQMNFRGSDGYGTDFMQMGLQNWGQAMQDDVADAAKWAIAEGYADPDKICIVGASYGGYAALMGSVKTPDLYKCAVSFGGVTDLAFLVSKSSYYQGHEIVEKMIGDNRRELKSRSPVELAEKIAIPVLLLHGEDDRVVRVHHSREMYDQLKDEDVPVTYIELEKGDHYLSRGNNRLAAFEAMDAFLQTHLK